MTVPIRLFLSQANQAHNAGPDSYTEKAGCAAITKATAKLLAKDDRFVVKRNSTGSRIDTAIENTDEANAWGAGRYVAVHSNAGMKGTICFYFSTSPKGKHLAGSIYRELAHLSPGVETGDRVQPHDGFLEIRRPHCPACLVEVEAHDWRKGTDFLTDERPAIARGLYDGICQGCDLEPLPAKKPVALLARQKFIPRPFGVRSGWRSLGLKRYLKKLRQQGDGARITYTATHISFPVPKNRPWWWSAMLAWVEEQRVEPEPERIIVVPGPPTLPRPRPPYWKKKK